MDIAELPFNSFIGIEKSSIDDFVLSLPGEEKYTNHLGTVHASALVALAEATSGECVIQLCGRLDFDVMPLVRRLGTKFRKPANGRIDSKFRVPSEAAETFLSLLQARGRAMLSVPVEVYDESGALAMTATVDWFVSKA